eukprot:TRINITY_DN12301_c0_g1_i1.p2 TRINITY_DN12301_c0_g1~~TRINITY_DN12301_c0_g1_i1.p2  ORF type:complete len:187 (-),score=45.78 TRINITY_DN12301_c0_g1_i1:352-912(-)
MGLLSKAVLVLFLALLTSVLFLPDPQPPSDTVRAVLLFDGVCHLCSGFVNFVMEFNGDESVMFASLQSEEGRALLEEVGAGEFGRTLSSMVLVEYAKGASAPTYAVRSRAALRTLARLDSPWPLLYRLFRLLPAPIADAAYNTVAAYRYNLFGKSDTCRQPTASERRRFLETAMAEECDYLIAPSP